MLNTTNLSCTSAIWLEITWVKTTLICHDSNWLYRVLHDILWACVSISKVLVYITIINFSWFLFLVILLYPNHTFTFIQIFINMLYCQCLNSALLLHRVKIIRSNCLTNQLKNAQSVNNLGCQNKFIILCVGPSE